MEEILTLIDFEEDNKQADVMMDAMNIVAILISVSFLVLLGVVIGASACGEVIK